MDFEDDAFVLSARAHGDWAVRFPASPGGVAFALITEGRCRLTGGPSERVTT